MVIVRACIRLCNSDGRIKKSFSRTSTMKGYFLLRESRL